jgi:hypothetical protein
MKKLCLLILCLLLGTLVNAQEMNCMVSISAPKLEGTDKKIFETLQSAIYEFMNNRKWTNYNVKVEERIECTMLITINERPAPDEFKGTLNVVLRRPVYNSAYNTVLLNYIDKDLTFNYVEYQPLDYSDGTYSSNLTSILAYYTYVMLGLYWDSYSPNGGTQFFQKAQDVVNVAQQSQESGWKAYESQRNRYWLVENYLNSIASPIREFNYKYHRLGLDQMYEKVDAGRNSTTASVDLLFKMYDARPDLFALTLTLDAKKDELVNIYSDSRVPPLEKNNVVNILKEIDPANGSKYQAILEAK